MDIARVRLCRYAWGMGEMKARGEWSGQTREEGNEESWWEGKQGLGGGLRKLQRGYTMATLESLLYVPTLPLLQRRLWSEE